MQNSKNVNTSVLIKFLIFCLLLLPSIGRADEVTLAADPWCPYNCSSDSLTPGILIEIANQAFAQAGHSVRYIEMPWTRAIEAVRSGEIDGLVGTGPSETPDLIFPKTELVQAEHMFFVNSDDRWNYTGLDSLATRTLGVVNGYSYGDLHLKYIDPYATQSERIVVVSGENIIKRLVRMLKVKRIDTLIEDKLAFFFNMKNSESAATIRPAGVYAKENIYIAFSPHNSASPEYADILTQFVTQNKQGVIDQIIQKYVK